jgi:hypothetical protein
MDEPWVELVKKGVYKKTQPFEVLPGGQKLRTAGPESAKPSTGSRQPR